MKIVIVFEVGKEFEIDCEKFEVTTNIYGNIQSIEWDGLKGNKPLWVALGKILYIYRKEEKTE